MDITEQCVVALTWTLTDTLGEELQRALRLRAPQIVIGYVDRAEGVFFTAGVH